MRTRNFLKNLISAVLPAAMLSFPVPGVAHSAMPQSEDARLEAIARPLGVELYLAVSALGQAGLPKLKDLDEAAVSCVVTDRSFWTLRCEVNGNHPEDFWGLVIEYRLKPGMEGTGDDTMELLSARVSSY